VKSLDPRQLLRDMFDAAVAAAQLALCIPRHLPSAPQGRLVVIGAGKASAAMARAVEDQWPGRDSSPSACQRSARSALCRAARKGPWILPRRPDTILS